MTDKVRYDLPSKELSTKLAWWLAGARGRLLRRAQVGLRRRVLEVGCGHGIVTAELARRAGGRVVCADRDLLPAAAAEVVSVGAKAIAADGRWLPFRSGSFDLVFYQNVLLWIGDVEGAVAEAARVLQPGGAVVALEPDYGGMMEHPPEVALQDLWLKGLRAAGADPLVGRRVPAACEAAGLQTWVELQSIPQPPTADTSELLLGLPLSESEQARVQQAARALQSQQGTWSAFVHVPYVLVVATKR